MKKNQNGITITILVVTIIVLTILLSVTMNVSTDLLSDTKIKSYVSEMLLIQARVKSMGETLEFEKMFNDDGTIKTDQLANIGYNETKVGTHVASIPATYSNQVSADAKSGGAGGKKWFTWNENNLKANGFDSDMLASGQQYYVNYATGDVVYSKGYSPLNNKSVTLYSLQSMLNYKQ